MQLKVLILLFRNIPPVLHRPDKKRTIETRSLLETLREEILAGRKFGGFGGFCPKPPN